MIRLLAIAFLVLFAGSVSAQPVRFPSVAVGTSEAGPEITGSMYKPNGAGPFPAIVLAHSCAGVNPHTDIWGKRLANWGYVAVAPDSFGPRGEKQVCTKAGVVTGGMRVPDIAGALKFLATQPDVRAGHIGLIGHSHGGWTVMRAVQKGYGLVGHGLKGSVAYYPFCQPQFDRDVAVPLLILIGDKDDWTPAESCRKLQAAGFAQPGFVEAIYYPTAYHSFDSPAPYRIVTVADGKSHHLEYDPVAAPDAEARTKAFFDKLLRP
jgi:dienelactone hydrolase